MPWQTEANVPYFLFSLWWMSYWGVKGLPFNKQTFIPLLLFSSCALLPTTTLFWNIKQEKGSFSSSSPIHDIRLTSRGAHQTTFLFILTWLHTWGSSLWSAADLGVLFSLLLCSSCSCSCCHQQLFGPSFKHNPFLWLLSYIQHSSNSFSNSLQGTQLLLLCVLLLKYF